MVLTLERPIVTLRDLQTDYGVEDLYNLLEVGLVRAHNERLIAKEQARRQREMMKG